MTPTAVCASAGAAATHRVTATNAIVPTKAERMFLVLSMEQIELAAHRDCTFGAKKPPAPRLRRARRRRAAASHRGRRSSGRTGDSHAT